MAKAKGGEGRPKIIIKKVKDKHGGHHGGAWKVAYADFVTAMMALFLVLWLVSTLDGEVKASVAKYFRDPGVFETTQGSLLEGQGANFLPLASSGPENSNPLGRLGDQLNEALRSLEEYPEVQDQIWIRLTSEGLLVDIVDKGERAFFDLGSAEVEGVLLHVLEKIVQQVNNLPNKVTVGGHTDARPYRQGAFYSNWELSAARALNARRAMEGIGLSSARVQRVVGYADSSPLFPADPLNPANRRISVLIMEDQPEPQALSYQPPASGSKVEG